MADATKKLIAKFSDPKEWERIDDDVPIFTEHTAYALLTDDGQIMKDQSGKPVLEIVMPGKEPPKNSKVMYTVDAERIRKIAANINAQLKDFHTPIKNFIGHSDQSKKQTEQPPLVGYSVGATVKPWGPYGKATIFSKVFTSKSAPKNVVEYVQRSPEYYPTKDVITGLALLKTDPRLPMGMLPYGEEGPVFYGQSLETYAFPPQLNKEKPAPSDPNPAPKAAQQAPQMPEEDPTENPGEKEKDEPQMDQGGDVDDMELNPDEAKTAMRYMAHYERHHPVIRYACDQFRAMQNQGQPAPAGQSQEKMNMQATELPVEYQQLPAKLDNLEKQLQESMVRYATAESTRIVNSLVMEGFKIKNPQAEIDKMKALDDAGRTAREAEIRENYQQTEQDPTRGPMVQVYAGGVEGVGKEDYYGRDMTAEQVNAMVAYAEKHELDLEDPEDLDKARKAVVKK